MRAIHLLVLGLVLVIADLAVLADPAKQPVAVAVVVAKGSKVTAMTSAELKRAFTGDAVSIAGTRLAPFNLSPSSGPRVGFDRAVLGMTADEVGRFWVDRKVRGQTGAPRALASTSQVLKVVAKFPGAIGYVPVNEVAGDVQVITVDGARPGDEDYPIWSR